MAGLLAAAMLRSDCDQIVEAQQNLPNNHSALLRFRSSIVGDTLGIEFKKVRVMKAMEPWANPVADAMAYARKATGKHTLRSSLSAKGDLEDRWIAPDNLIELMYHRVQCPINFGCALETSDERFESPIISTIPMPTLMQILNYEPRPQFTYRHGVNINLSLDPVAVDAFVTVYVPDPAIAFSRVSLTGNRLTIEFSGVSSVARVAEKATSYIQKACELLGIEDGTEFVGGYDIKEQKFAKILPIDDDERKRFIQWATTEHNIYSLGRFATWRPGLLLDDVVNDVRVIQRLINAGHSYDHRKVI